MKSAVTRAAQTGKPVCVLIFDIDHFKGVNDVYGHDAGDDVLKDFSERLRRAVRGIDLVARYGGEEFMLVMPETDAEFAGDVAERLRSEVEKVPFSTRSGALIPVTVSIGIAEWRGVSETAENLISRADAALYAAKRSGRNRVVAERRLTQNLHRIAAIFIAVLTKYEPSDGNAPAHALQCAWRGQRGGCCLFGGISNTPWICSGPPHLLGPWGRPVRRGEWPPRYSHVLAGHFPLDACTSHEKGASRRPFETGGYQPI